MKKIFAVLSIVLLIAAAALASITLSAGSVQTRTQGGVTQETDDTAAVTAAEFQFQAGIMLYRVELGQMNGSTFAPGPKAQSVQIAVNLATGAWRSQDGSLQGTLTAPQLLSANNVAKNLRNGLENLTINQNIAPGTQVSW